MSMPQRREECKKTYVCAVCCLLHLHSCQTSDCNGLKAVDHANVRKAKGYAVSGQGGCDCARHGFKLTAVDLTAGEK